MNTPRNPILIGQVEVIDLVLPAVRAMLQRQGIYLASDSARPGCTVPLVVNEEGVWSMQLDVRLEPERFRNTVRIAGPFFAPGEEIPGPDGQPSAAQQADAVALIVEALKHSKPMAYVYPEARKRHEDALAAAQSMLAAPATAAPATELHAPTCIDPADPWRGLYAPELMPTLDGTNDWIASHPDLPQWPDDEERGIDNLIKAQGFAYAVVGDEYPDEDDTGGEAFDTCAWLAAWKPEPPAGEHWRLVMIHDTEDGPAAVFVRPLALSEMAPKSGDARVVPYQRALDLIGDAYNAGTHGIGYSQQAMELHDAVQSASKEQP